MVTSASFQTLMMNIYISPLWHVTSMEITLVCPIFWHSFMAYGFPSTLIADVTFQKTLNNKINVYLVRVCYITLSVLPPPSVLSHQNFILVQLIKESRIHPAEVPRCITRPVLPDQADADSSCNISSHQSRDSAASRQQWHPLCSVYTHWPDKTA